MNEHRDAMLQALFEDATDEFAGRQFEADVLARIGKARRRTMIVWSGIAAAALIGAWLLIAPLFSVMGLFAEFLPQTLIDIDNRVVAEMLAPINSLSGAIGACFLVIWMGYRKIFS
jgi:hypothetical protein